MTQDTKTAILFEPQNMAKEKPVFSFILFKMQNGKKVFWQEPLSKVNINKFQLSKNKSLQLALEQLSNEEHKKSVSAIYRQMNPIANNNAEKLLKEALQKHYHQQFLLFASLAAHIQTMDRIVNPKTGNLMVRPCSCQSDPGKLKFFVAGNKNNVHLKVTINLLHKSFPVHSVTHYGNLYCYQDLWFYISGKDQKTIEWLEKMQPEMFSSQPQLFAEKILAKLEESYAVERNNLFDINEIRTVPKPGIYFAELSNAFLMLTPRWNYDGLMVDGTFTPEVNRNIKGVQYTIFRQEAKEKEFITFIETLHADFPAQAHRGYYFLSFANAKKRQWFIKTYRELLKNDIEIYGLDMLNNFRYCPYDPAITIEPKGKSGNTLELHVKVSFGKEEVSLQEIQKTLLSGQRNILLKDDSIAFFPDEWIETYGMLFKHAQIYKQRMTIPSWVLLNVNKDASIYNFVSHTLPADWRQHWMDWQTKDILYPKPSMIQTALRPYQQKGYEWLRLLSEIEAGACLADDMGLGKTLQTICFLAYQAETFPETKSIVICPASLLYNWEAEIKKFAPGLRPYIYNAAQRDFEKFKKSPAQILITTYHMLRQDVEALQTYNWQVAVIDESQNIKNPSALITKAVYALAARNRIALSGTPIMNNTFDLYAQLQFLLPGLLGNREFFKREYADPIDRDKNEERTKNLRQLTQPFILRRTKSQVAKDLPEKTESILWCEMGEKQMAFYNEVKADIRDSIFLDIKKTGMERSKLNILQGIQKLRQICDAPQLVKNAEAYTPCEESVKIDQIITALAELRENGNKALIFSQFTGMLQHIAGQCEKEGIAFYHFDGSTPIDQRRTMVDKFQSESDTTTAFLISLKAGNAGLNLTNAQYVYLVDPWWNQAVEQQAIDRTHRIGQTQNVFAYRMICKGTIEEKIISLQQKKKLLSDELVGAEESLVKNLSMDDLEFLLA